LSISDTTHKLYIAGDVGDDVTASGGFVDTLATEMNGGVTYRIYQVPNTAGLLLIDQDITPVLV
jgi:hypothetical protein